MPSYSVTVATGSQWFAGTDDYVYFTLVGSAGSSERHLLDKSFYNDFERGAVCVAESGYLMLLLLCLEQKSKRSKHCCHFLCVRVRPGTISQG
ncbi:UNVERIFIED_CONTAM: hypothetical protein K2H54_018923 [Gekko kuhli]